MITGELRSRVDRLWNEFWTGGIANPLTVIEQISFLMFSRFLDLTETRNEKKAKRTKKPFKRLFNEDQQDLRWSYFRQKGAVFIDKDGKERTKLEHVRDKVFPHFKTVAVDGAKFGEYMKDAQLMIQKDSLLTSAIEMINDLPLTEGDIKGDLYEYLPNNLILYQTKTRYYNFAYTVSSVS